MKAFINEPIAVIGSSCKLPGDSTSPSKLWELLKDPKDISRRIDRYRADNWHNEDGHHHGASNVLDAYLLDEDPKAFDAQFFSISGGEADSIDPQQRVLLETVFEGLDSAGLAMESLQGSPTAVYVGVMCDDYNDIVYNDGESIPKYAATGSARSILSNRVSYFFNWTGPSMTIDTACSSSLVGVHQAVQVLRSGESNLAIAAGSNLIFGPKMFIAESNLNMLSPNGKSRMWDADADGYARGEGVACVVLKRLSDAIAAGDSIECIIRETGVNQDGRTPGITMPSSSAQAALIRQTYAKAGLDPRQESDRCQYFEAHGTGTKAGDPREAGAIHEAFFGNRTHDGTSDPDDVLYVGSIKTVVGHTEGTAGIAGLIKASLAIQNATIPPNLLFSKLNPEIEPFYTHLQIPTSAKPWPTLADGNVRRASVNSFGFGGTNAHAIIELYDPVSYQSQPASSSVIPYVLSASSERSLVANVKSHMSFLLENPEVDLDAATWTLTKRSTHNYRISFAGLTPETLCEKMQQAIEDKEARNILMGTRPSTKGRGFLGVFTGQGAQWASASSKLIQSSPTAKATILKLEKSLSDLPVGDRPDWSLEAELMAQEPESRIAEGRMSQPLCTAIQIILVDLLKSAGITFSAVVGHSSGEIGAAYAAGYISASDAIRIAYYRGLYVCLARGPGGQKGAMVAVGTSPEDANDLCQLRRLRGKLQLAACNSNASVTLSGDDEAVDLAVRIFKDEGKFARKLKVDTAYHSHHMEPCGEVYVSALQACQIELLSPTGPECRWYSSVQTGRLMDEQCEELADTYWRDNMLKPVYFAQALSEALDDGEAPSVVLEVGPHPALKGPAGQIIQDVLNVELPYTGVLSRGKNDIEAFAEGLGFVWANSSAATVNFDGFSNEFTDHSKPNRQILKTLPLYAWDHSRTHWFETRMSRTQRLRKDRPHSLLGVHTSDETENELRWRNYIKPKELPWLEGHKIQGQLLFPGSGFAVMALEAACTLAPRSEIQTVLIDSFTIHRALSFANEDDGAETMFVLSSIERTSDYITASFVLSACLNANTGAFTSMASGSLSVSLGAPSPSALPSRPKQAVGLRHVDTEEFYNDLSRIGYNYSDMFKGIVRLERKADACSGVIVCQGTSEKDLMLHPAPFDVGFQAAFAALGAPGDGRLWALHIPTHIDKIRFNPHANVKDGAVGGEVPFDAYITDSESYEIVSDIELYDVTGVHCLLQVEGLHVSPLSTATSATDRAMFAEMEYAHDQPDASTLKATRVHADPRALEGLFPERCMLFYLKQVYDQITPEERETFDEHRVSIYNWAAYLVDLVSKNQHPHLRTEWLNDTIDILRPQMDEWLHILIDFDKLIFVGERLLPFVKGEISMLEEFRNNNILDWLYKEAIGTSEYNAYLGGLLKQLSFRYPRQNILEIGAGTGSATNAAIKALGDDFATYTYTDISTAFFSEAQGRYKDLDHKFVYKKLDVEQDISEQGFVEHSYDVIVASNVLHATQSLEATLKNTRRLLKPGGSLIILEITAVEWLRSGFMFCGFADWWAGRNDGRQYTPTITQDRWHELFKSTGFSGVDTAVSPRDYMTPYSVILTQAVDTQINSIREPLSKVPERPLIKDVVVLGGNKMTTFDLVDETVTLIQPFASNIRTLAKLEELNTAEFDNDTLILSFAELDEPVFDPFSPEKYSALQRLSERSQNVLWITQGALGEKPHANMMHGIARCLLHERSDSRFQVIDFDVSFEIQPKYIAETFLRLYISHAWSKFSTPYAPQWSFEREIYVGKDGLTVIPRYKYSTVLNERYNASRRLVKAPLDINQSTIEIAQGDFCEIAEVKSPIAEVSAAENGDVKIMVEKSSLRSFKLSDTGYGYLVYGKAADSGKKLLALTGELRSSVWVPESQTIELSIPEDQESAFFSCVANELLAEGLLKSTSKNDHLVIHNAADALINAINRRVAKEKLTLTSDNERGQLTKVIQASTPSRTIQAIIPPNTAVFIDASTGTSKNVISSKIRKILRPASKVLDLSSVMSNHGSAAVNLTSPEAKLALEKACSVASLQFTEFDATNVQLISLDDVSGPILAHDPLTVVDWRAQDSVTARVYPPEDYARFKDDVTYLLVGMTGELGMSLSEWMIERGARNIALTSRSPKVDENWIAAMKDLGARVETFAMDVTDRRSLMNAYKAIKQTMPRVAGVCNGAMVLIDGLLSNMPYDTFNSVIRPKVEGTILLDQLFSENTLDFFIMFSSLTCVTGNIGQTPYAASNCFMVSMAEGRRKRGLAGSVINLAGIFGIGYINRTDKKIHDRLENMGYGGVSEWDFHQFFAEASIASPSESGKTFEVSNGLISFDPKDPAAPAWLNNSKFSRFVSVKGNDKIATSNDDPLSIRGRLLQQTTEDGVYDVLLSSFIGLLYQKLNMPPEENAISPESGLVELGIDSLVAVDVRTWFTKELGVEVKILTLLGGASIATLIADAASQLDKSLIPLVAVDTEEQEVSTEKESSPSISVDSSSELDSTVQTSLEASIILEPTDNIKEAPKEVRNLEKTVSMPFGSTQFWYLQQFLEDPHTSNIEFRLELSSHVDVPRLEHAFKLIGQRHEALRACFYVEPSSQAEPTMGILDTSRFEIVTKTISNPEEADAESKALLSHTWDLEHGLASKVTLFTLNPSKHYLIFGFHHIVIDGFSFNLILNEMNALYEGKQLPPIDLTFSNWASEQRQLVESGSLSQELDFWRSELADLPDPLPLLPMASVDSRQTLTSYHFEESEEITLSTQTLTRIKDLCKRHKVSNFHFFLAIFKIFLFRYLDVEKVCIGLADAGRNDSRTHNTVGYLLNLLPLIFENSPKQKFAEALQEARAKTFSALSNSRVPFTVLLDDLKVPRSTTHNPIYQAFIDYRQINAEAGVLGAKSSGQHSPGRSANDMILDLSAVSNDEIRLSFKVQSTLYSKEAANIMLKSYLQLIDNFTTISDYQIGKLSLSKVPLFNARDIAQAQELARGGTMDLGHYLTTSHLIERHCVEFADQIALKDGLGGSMTWASMKDKIDDICSTLLDNNVTEGVFIGIYQEPSVVWICSLLAIWKVGAIYVPLDPRDSLERLLAIIEDCKPAFILTIDSSISKAHNLLSFGSKLINVSSAARDNSKQIVVQAKPYSVSTVLYTSGSTGKPKGIQLNHHGLLNHCLVYGKTHGLERERLLQQCAFSFDLCQDQVIIALAHGGSVYVASSAQRAEPALIARVIREEMITATVATPSEYHAWIKHGHEHLKDASGWKFAISGGESITHGLLRAFKNCNVPNLTLLNLYGPSEISIGILSVEVDYKNPDLTTAVPIGRPLRNYAAYIVDRNMDPVPIGVDGELIAAGAGVAQGYHNQPELTKEKFLPDNMTPPGYFDKHWNRLYKTGDMGRRQADGTILFKGRASGDTQVKLNGIRIELSAVENALVKASQGCLVGAICTIRDGVMVAHVEFDSTSPEIGRPEFLKALGLALPLPKYMTPGIILELEKIPLTRHGKADRKQIASLPLSQTEVPAEQSDLSASEMVLKDIWLQVLPPAIAKSLSITADSDFFLCGGNSLSIVNVQNLIRKEFKVSLPIIDLLEASELRSMATKIENGTTLTEIDWDDETKLEDDLIQAATGATPRESKRTTGLSVVLTGATGHLGGHFLSRLVQDDRVSKIHCVSVRRESPKPRNALLASSKIVVHWGDLADSKLGLSPAVYEHLARHADIIFHLGADRSFWDHYHLTKGPNFTSTKSLVQLSVSRHIPLHFISSAAVLDSTGETSSHGIPTTYPPTDGTSGYMASKWASEVYIEKAVTTLGLPLFIHRVTAYPGDSTTHADLSSVFLDLADKMKVIPDWEGWTGNFDVMEADALATDIINTAIIQPSTPSDTVLVTNHPCDTRVYLAELEAYMNAHTKDRSSYETCPPHEWAGKAKLAGVGYHFGTMQFQISNHETSDVLEVKR